MPSGKKSRQRPQASPKVIGAIGGVLLLVAVAIVLAVVLTRGSSSSKSSAKPLPGKGLVNSLFKGIPQRGTTLGSSKAPVTLREFIDLQCPSCDQFETQVFPDIVTHFVRAGKLRVLMEPLAFIGPDSVRGQAAVLAAGGQGRAFNYAALLYANQGTENTGWLNDTMVTRVAQSIPGLDVKRLLAERSSPSVQAEAQQVDATGSSIRQTPTLIVGKT